MTQTMIEPLKTFIARLPIIGALTRRLWRKLRHAREVWRSPYRLQDMAQAYSTHLAEHAKRFESCASTQDLQKLRREILMLRQRLDLLSQASMPSSPSPIAPALPEGFYLAFENRFRGDFTHIQARQSVYLPIVQNALAMSDAHPILDIGSGRGEWLQLLAQHAVNAYGVDSDPSMVATSLDLGLDVREGHALEHLTSLHENELSAITGFHIAEHIPFNTLITLFDESLRVLKPGGVLILETPNPENLLVGACYFHTDPTHLHPLPPDLLAFVAENCGFAQVEIMRLHPFPQYADSLAKGNTPSDAERFLFGPQDYALIAYKPLEIG